MADSRTFSADDFEQEPRGPRLFDSWAAREPLDNPLGRFEVLVMEAPPDEQQLLEINALAAFVSNEYDAIFNVVYEHYLQTAEDKGWMKGCGVPANLREDRVMRYIKTRSISVRRDRGRVEGTISIRPQWDPEHGIHLQVVNGRLVPRM